MQCIAVLVLMASLCGQCLASGWMQQPYANDDEFNIRREYLNNATMNCSDQIINVTYTPDYWILPNLKIMGPGEYHEFLTIDGMAGWEVT